MTWRWNWRSVIIITVTLVCLLALWGCMPGLVQTITVEPTAGVLVTKTPVATRLPLPTPTALAMEQRLIIVEFPGKIRAGDADVLRLSLIMDENGQITPTAKVEGHTVSGEPVEIPNLYDSYNIIAEARLDMAGLEVQPQGAVKQPMQPNVPVVFVWSLSPDHPGNFRGMLWLYLNLIPKTGGAQDQRALLARPVEIKAVTVLGMTAPLARWIGAIGSVFSFVFGIPFLEDVLRRFFKRKKDRSESPDSSKSGDDQAN